MFKNAIEFSQYITDQAYIKDLGLLEFLTEYVIENSIDEESIPELLTPALKANIEIEARAQYSMPKITNEEIDL